MDISVRSSFPTACSVQSVEEEATLYVDAGVGRARARARTHARVRFIGYLIDNVPYSTTLSAAQRSTHTHTRARARARARTRARVPRVYTPVTHRVHRVH